MTLSVRPKPYQLPTYSLTGDLIAFLRCGLQYRYSRIGRLPPSRPVQLWFGEFIHGVLEEAYRRHQDLKTKGKPALPPWPNPMLADIMKLIVDRLAARGLIAWDPVLKRIGAERAEVAIQELGPHLFPLISEAEVRLSGARILPAIPSSLQFRTADRYEMAGIVDVLTEIQFNDPKLANNPLIRLILPHLPAAPPATFEVIVDYKGMRRPPSKGSDATGLWTQYEWQVLTYAELRKHQSGSKPVVAGALIYINELSPTRGDLERLKKEVVAGTTDMMPPAGTSDDKAIRGWNTKGPLIKLSWNYRLSRAIRVIPVTPAGIQTAAQGFDKVVQEIEICRGKEVHGASVLSSWTRNPSEEGTCVVCDSRTYCPDYQTKYAAQHNEKQPRLPGIKD